jgi:hypothetical protein
MLGTAKKVTITKDETTVVEGAGTVQAVQGRIAQIKKQIETTDSSYDREKLQERLAKLAGGVAVIQVGAATETELKEKKHRFEDALSATRAAVEEGIVPGGGVALINVIAALDSVQPTTTMNGWACRSSAGAGGAAAPDRRERRPRRLGRGQQGQDAREGPGLQRADRGVRRHGRLRRRRPGQGDPLGAAETPPRSPR